MSDVRRPFVGTRPFSRADSPFFFGREREASRLANMVSAGTMTVLYGESGVGKSSLINARLPIALEECEPDWSVIAFFEWQPGFESRLDGVIHDEIGIPPQEPLAKRLLSFAQKNDNPVLLALDQFEEYFLYNPNGNETFEAELARLINRRLSPVRVLFSLRSDGLFLLDRLRLRIPDIFTKMMLIEPLDDRAAIDCIICPVAEYNREASQSAVTVPSRDSELVRALVLGAQEQAIRRLLPSRGKGAFEKEQVRRPRMVAPFLEMALDALWQQDIIVDKRTELRLETLCRLAGIERQGSDASASGDSSQAVGRLAQKHVDSILRPFSDEEKAVCALVFERMVLPSGQKIAVQMSDLSAFLSDDQQRLAPSILIKLSEGPDERLVKTVAPATGEATPHFQIIHDAMAIPVLGWIEKWRRDQRAARARAEAEERAARDLADEREKSKARAKRARRVIASISMLLISLLGSLTYVEFNKYLSVKSHVDRALSYLNDPLPHFRVPLLVTLSSLSEARRLWWYPTEEVELQIRKKLFRSPRDGGWFTAVGFAPQNATVVGFDERLRRLVICVLPETDDCNMDGEKAATQGRPYAIEMPPPQIEISDTQETLAGDLTVHVADRPRPTVQKSARRLRQNVQYSVGFVEGFKDPILHRAGFVYIRRESVWQKYDLAQLLPDFDEHPGPVFVEIIDGSIRATINDWPNNRMWVARIVTKLGADPPLAPADNKWLSYNWQPGAPNPVLSPNSLHAASFALRQSTGQATELGLAIVSRSSEIGRTESVPIGSFEFQGANPSPGRLGSIGFTSDSRSAAALSQSGGTIVRLGDKLRGTSFGLDESIGNPAPFLGGLFSTPSLSVAETIPGTWRIAWRSRGGIRLAEIRGDASLVTAQKVEQALLPDLENPNRLALNFSSDGSFLVLQSQQLDPLATGLRIWDLRPNWKQQVQALEGKGFSELRRFVCRVAVIGSPLPDYVGKPGDELTDEEKRTWDVSSQPCR